MTATDTPEYRKLALDSSNDMIRYDSRWAMGEYTEAVIHIRSAGLARLRMGQIKFDAGEFAFAAEDWLSAGECFFLGTDLERLRECVERVQRLEQEGKIPADRRHILAAIREREDQIRTLEARLEQLPQDYGRVSDVRSPNAGDGLRWLLGRLREFAGHPTFHLYIFLEASRLGMKEVAAQHLAWTCRLYPDDATFTSILGRIFVTAGDPDQAIEIGRRYLAEHPDAPFIIRVMLTDALISGAGGRAPDLEAAVEVLQPVAGDATVGVSDRLAALGLSASFLSALGRDDEARQLVATFDELAARVQSPDVRGYVLELRQAISALNANGGDSAPGDRNPLTEPVRARLFRAVEQLSLYAITAAA